MATVDDIPAATLVFSASKIGDVESIRKAVAAGARVDQPDDLGNTPLHYAANAGHVDAVQELLTAFGAPVNAVNSAGDTPLHKAAARGHAAVVKALLAAGADATLTNALGQTANDGAFDAAVKDALASAGTGGEDVDYGALLGADDDDDEAQPEDD